MPLGRWRVSIHAENKLDAFLAGLPSYQRKYLEQGLSSLTRAETDQFNEWFEKSAENLSASSPKTEDFLIVDGVYRLLLAQAPANLKERRKREERQMREFSRSFINIALPKVPTGAPKKDALTREAVELKNIGLSYTRTANRLNQRHAKEIASGKMRRATTESVRKLIKRFESAQPASPRTKSKN
jgi:hypothetical protein